MSLSIRDTSGISALRQGALSSHPFQLPDFLFLSSKMSTFWSSVSSLKLSISLLTLFIMVAALNTVR